MDVCRQEPKLKDYSYFYFYFAKLKTLCVYAISNLWISTRFYGRLKDAKIKVKLEMRAFKNTHVYRGKMSKMSKVQL